MQFKTYIHFYFRYHYGVLCTYCIWFLTKIIHVFLGTCTTSYPYSVVYFVYFEIILIYFMLQWWRLWPKTNWGGSSLHISQFRVHKAELKARTWGQEIEHRAGNEYCLILDLLVCSVCFLITHSTTYPVVAPVTVDWALLQQLSIKKMSQSLAYKPISPRNFLNWSYLFPDDYSLSS